MPTRRTLNRWMGAFFVTALLLWNVIACSARTEAKGDEKSPSATKDTTEKKPDTGKTAAVVVKQIATGNSKVAVLLRKWHKEGTAAGNTGDFYDNRDGGHSRLNTRAYPQLGVIELTEAEKELIRTYKEKKIRRRVHWGLLTRDLYPHVTLGNSSTAMKPPWGCSNTRYCILSSRTTAGHYRQYRRSHLYVYPEHKDHDPGHNGRGGWGDLYHANVPYFITSQGSSGSDKPFLRAIASTLAAFRPEVKKLLIKKALLMPTVQYIFRRCNKHIKTDADYLTGRAHPSAFEKSNVDALAMVKLAHEMQADAVPPMIQLAVVEEDESVVGRDYFEVGEREKIFTTPAAVARVARSTKHVRRMVVSAKGSLDVNKRPLKFHWVVLRGDAKRIKINPRNEDASVVEILVPYHERMPVPGNPRMESNRVDIGAFVHNGKYHSAPGFVTFYSMDDEARTYDADGRILEVCYGYGDTRIGHYAHIHDNKKYDIADWKALLDVLTDAEGGFPSTILRKRFTADELKAFDEVRKAFNDALTPTAEQKKGIEETEAKVKEAQAAVNKAKKELEDAEDTDTTAKAAVKRTERKLFLDKYSLRCKKRAVKNAPGVVLKESRPALGGASAIVKVEDALNAFKNDVNFYFRNNKALDALCNASTDEEKKKAFLSARTELAGKFKDKAKGKLTKYERNRIERLNIAVLQSVVYPTFLNWKFRRNFVDRRIKTVKTWRDVYHYDAGGRMIGWTRHSEAGEEEFTADGALIVKKDRLGRALLAQTVRYVVKDKKQGPRLLEQEPGDTVLHYKYDSDADRVGHVEKREKPAPADAVEKKEVEAVPTDK